MYLICLSGALAVFNQEFERWEQPDVAESTELQPELAETALRAFIDRYGMATEHLHLVFPSSGIPRLVVENDDRAHFVKADGSLGPMESSPWTSMLLELHYYLHLPHTIGIILVSVCGVMLLALTLSGVLAHSRIIKDAFRLRLGGAGTQQRIDLHNRLSVWGLPFHVMISFTGAYYGLVGVLLLVTAQTFYAGDTTAVAASVFTPEPERLGFQDGRTPDVARAMDYVRREDPTGNPVFLTIHEPGSRDEFIEIYVQQAGRLLYSENYRFDGQGNFVERGGYRDGAAGKQVIYSLYRVHFGDFAGPGTKGLYFVLGMTLTVIAATGVGIWLSKRKRVTVLNALWPAFVWGAPLALALCAGTSLCVDTSMQTTFWLALAAITMIACRWPLSTIGTRLRAGLAVTLASTVAIHLVRHSEAAFAPAAWPINLGLLLAVIALGATLRDRSGSRIAEPSQTFSEESRSDA